jgi:uncharacterized phage protein (TIGR02218 family)
METFLHSDADLLKITRFDSNVYRFANHDVDVVWNSETYSSANGFRLTNIRKSSSLKPDTVTLGGWFSASGVIKQDLIAARFDGAKIELFDARWDEEGGASDRIIGIVGFVGNVRYTDFEWEFEVEGLEKIFNENLMRQYEPACNADLFDDRCGVNSANYVETLTVDAVTDNGDFTATISDSYGHPVGDGWFADGEATWTGGNNNGDKSEIDSYTHATGRIVLKQFAYFDIQVGDTATLLPGCNKSGAVSDGHCNIKYDNLDRGRMFNRMPQRNTVRVQKGNFGEG